jgi:hypothetical protein
MDVPAPVAAPAPQNTAARTTSRPAANQPERILREVLDAILGKR